MIRHIWSVLCSRSVIDTTSNNISLLEVVEKITFVGPGGIGFAPTQLELVSLWSRSDFAAPERGRGRVTVMSQAGVTLHPSTVFDIDLNTYLRVRSRLQIGGLPVIADARFYEFRIELEREGVWGEVGSIPLELEISIQPAAPELAAR